MLSGGIPFNGTAPTITVTVSPAATTTYTVISLMDVSCTSIAGDLSGSATVSVNPNPILVTTPQSACSPNRIDLTAPQVTAGSTLYGATLTYWTDAAATIPVPVPTAVVTGTYYIKATTLAGCYSIQPVAATINPKPAIYSMTGGGSYCAGGTGLPIGLTGSSAGVIYTLWLGSTQIGAALTGTGNPISFGLQTLAGTYSAMAENTTTHCTQTMSNTITISINPLLPVSVSIEASQNPVATGTLVTFTATPVNGGSTPSYQWKVNGIDAGTGSAYAYVPINGDAVTCVLTSNAACVSGNPATSVAVIMTVTGVPATFTITGTVGSSQAYCYNATQTLTVAGGTTTFTVSNGGSATMIAGQNIKYLPGTTVMPGGYMHGYISTVYCGLKEPALVTTPTGEDELPQIQQPYAFKLYPNPTTGKFTLEQKGEKTFGKIRVEIYGMRGERLVSQDLTGEKKHEFWLTDLPQGLYFVKVVADEYGETFKLVITR
jgi:hypothetical protein